MFPFFILSEVNTMKRHSVSCLVGLLLVANGALAVALAYKHSIPAQSGRQGLTISELTYGKIDVDGDGRYTAGDDHWVALALQRWPEALESALKDAKKNQDGGADLSPFLKTIRHRAVTKEE